MRDAMNQRPTVASVESLSQSTRMLRFGTLLCAAMTMFSTHAQAQSTSAPPLSATVNTFIGSKDEGNTFPGASAPFGLVQVSPIGTHYAGWRYDDEKIFGFGHSFLSGAGCWEQG